MNRFPYLPARILKVRGLNWVQLHPDGLNSTLLSKDYVLEAAANMPIVGGMYFPRTREGWGASNCPGPAHRSTRGHILSMASSNSAPC